MTVKFHERHNGCCCRFRPTDIVIDHNGNGAGITTANIVRAAAIGLNADAFDPDLIIKNVTTIAAAIAKKFPDFDAIAAVTATKVAIRRAKENFAAIGDGTVEGFNRDIEFFAEQA